MNNIENGKASSVKSVTQYVIGVLVFGSIWGFLEATLGGFLHLINVPNTGAIMSGVGMAVMGAALAVFRKPVMLPGIGIVAASFKLLNVWLLFVPANVPHIINPIVAIMLEALALSLAATFLINRMEKSNYVGVRTAVLAGLVSAIAFAWVAVYVTRVPINTRLGIDSIREFVIGNGLIQAVFCGVLAPLGYVMGKKLAIITPPLFIHRYVYYIASASTVMSCWGLSALAVITGL
jgi:hypothetical protein